MDILSCSPKSSRLMIINQCQNKIYDRHSCSNGQSLYRRDVAQISRIWLVIENNHIAVGVEVYPQWFGVILSCDVFLVNKIQFWVMTEQNSET